MKRTVAFYLLVIMVAQAPGLQAWELFLDGSTLPEEPWERFDDGDEEERGDTEVIEFIDPSTGAINKALRLNSGKGAHEWYIGEFQNEEVAAGARFRVVEFSPEGKENLLSLTTRSKHLSPAPSITLVDGRFKLWNYVEADSEIIDIGPVVVNVFHTVYLYARSDGLVKLWWDGKLIYDDFAPLVNPYNGYFEWGSGSWQFDATDTIDFDWVGFGGPSDLPLAAQVAPSHGSIFQDASKGFQFSVVSQSGLAPGVAASGIALTANGVDQAAALAITGDDRNRHVFYGGLQADQIYRMVVQVTDLTGTVSTYPITFDTFRSSHLSFEAEDFNFEGGQFLDVIQPGLAAAADNYLDRVGLEGVDHLELSLEFGRTHHYRENSLVATEQSLDVPRPQYLAAQVADPGVADFNVTSVEEGEWLNYTRTFPAGNYYVYGRLASGQIGENFVASLAKVTNPTSANQTVSALGVFKGGPGGGWQTYEFVPLTDAQGKFVVVPLNGGETLRVTATQSAYNSNFFMLVPATESGPVGGLAIQTRSTTSGPQLNLSWKGVQGIQLQKTGNLANPNWQDVANSDGASSLELPAGADQEFFRLIRR